MNEKTRRLIRWASGEPQPPVTIELIPTDRCNFNCPSCWRQSVPKEELEKKYDEEMTDERLLELIDEAAELGVRDIAFVGGGEPLARDITYKLMKRIRAHGMEGDLVTNGSLLTDEMIDTLVDAGWTRVKFSVDGSAPELQDELRGSKAYNKTVSSIRKMAEAKKRKRSDVPRISFNTVISNKNYDDLPNIVDLADKVGCNEILLLPMTVFSKEGEKLKMNAEEMVAFQGIIKSCLPKLKKYKIDSNMERFIDLRYVDKTNTMHEVLMEEAEKIQIRDKIKKGERLISGKKQDPLENFMTMPCFEPWTHITIIPNGQIAACFNDYVWSTKVTIKDNSLKELWYGPYFERYRKQILSRTLPEACATCCVWRVFEVQMIRDEMKQYLKKKR